MKSQRREEIRKILESKPFVSLRELTLEFPDVSEMTIRRDIEFFEREGAVIRVLSDSMMLILACTAEPAP